MCAFFQDVGTAFKDLAENGMNLDKLQDEVGVDAREPLPKPAAAAVDADQSASPAEAAEPAPAAPAPLAEATEVARQRAEQLLAQSGDFFASAGEKMKQAGEKIKEDTRARTSASPPTSAGLPRAPEAAAAPAAPPAAAPAAPEPPAPAAATPAGARGARAERDAARGAAADLRAERDASDRAAAARDGERRAYDDLERVAAEAHRAALHALDTARNTETDARAARAKADAGLDGEQLEYLRTTIVCFLKAREPLLKKQLLPVLARVLKLDPADERAAALLDVVV
ncbi:hypothetical protein SO694_000253115 [Aureococcus anophagefferens]|uniref:GRIP domain-containing protein n=1 Tax=Aureococcus anophagefferens TaxID=44056 RepID=A0ABR1FVA3_AURAN